MLIYCQKNQWITLKVTFVTSGQLSAVIYRAGHNFRCPLISPLPVDKSVVRLLLILKCQFNGITLIFKSIYDMSA